MRFDKTIFNEMKISFDTNEAVQIFMHEHTKATPYDDVEAFFCFIKREIADLFGN